MLSPHISPTYFVFLYSNRLATSSTLRAPSAARSRCPVCSSTTASPRPACATCQGTSHCSSRPRSAVTSFCPASSKATRYVQAKLYLLRSFGRVSTFLYLLYCKAVAAHRWHLAVKASSGATSVCPGSSKVTKYVVMSACFRFPFREIPHIQIRSTSSVRGSLMSAGLQFHQSAPWLSSLSSPVDVYFRGQSNRIFLKSGGP
jgi:hypothetical protein